MSDGKRLNMCGYKEIGYNIERHGAAQTLPRVAICAWNLPNE
jgi:hypothetical protein